MTRYTVKRYDDGTVIVVNLSTGEITFGIPDGIEPCEENRNIESSLDELVALNEAGEENIDFLQFPNNGNTPTGVRSFTIIFFGQNGQLNGVPVPDRFEKTFSGSGQNTIANSMPFVVPNANGVDGIQRVYISTNA